MIESKNIGQSSSAAGARPSIWQRIAAHPAWPWAKRLAKVLFFSLVAYLLISQARTVDWQEVFSTLRERPIDSLLRAAAFAALSYVLYSSFDLLGRQYTGHQLSTGKVMTATFISYAFNLNMGALVGGVAFRYRLYSRLGLEAAVTTQVLFLSMLTNWLGYLLLGGLVFWWWPISLPPDWKIDSSALRALGFALFAISIAYLVLCAFARKRTYTIRGKELPLPSLRMALVQLLVSSANWLIIAGTIFLLLEQKLPFPDVLSVLLIAAIAGVITHVPAGLGVLEAVFIALLSHKLPKSELLAALLMYRFIYYLAPLMLATVVYLLLEAKTKKDAQQAGAGNR